MAEPALGVGGLDEASCTSGVTWSQTTSRTLTFLSTKTHLEVPPAASPLKVPITLGWAGAGPGQVQRPLQATYSSRLVEGHCTGQGAGDSFGHCHAREEGPVCDMPWRH